MTQINSGNQTKYEALFAKAALDLQREYKTNDQITSLETYFSKIDKLLNLEGTAGLPNYGRMYTILPLDEEYFDIDLNTRTIKVPDGFKKNGIAVKGDMGAETIYFKVPRYFDAIDLNNTTIYIQWQYTSAETKLPVQGISQEWVRDIESEDDYLIFGWTLGGKITAQAGTLQFSVRFLNGTRKGEVFETVSYSLSTLTTTVLINAGLDFDVEELIPETFDEIIAANYVPTTSATDSEIRLFRYVKEFFDSSALSPEENNTKLITRDLQQDGKLPIELSAYVSPLQDNRGDVIEYFIYKQTGEKPNENQDLKTRQTMNIIYEPTSDNTYQANGFKIYYIDNYVKTEVTESTYQPKTYYKQINDDKGNTIYVLEEEDAVFNPEEEYFKQEKIRYLHDSVANDFTVSGPIYERFGCLDLKEAGTYYGIAKITINGNISGPRYTGFNLSIPGPTPLVLNENLEKDGIQYIGHFPYSLDDEGKPQFNSLQIKFEQINEQDVTNYAWYKVESEEIKNENNQQVVVRKEVLIPEATDNNYIPTTYGKYRAKITATRNNAVSETVETNNFIVTHKPKKPSEEEKLNTQKQYPSSNDINNPSFTLFVKDNNDINIAPSKLKYLLYKYNNNDPENPEFKQESDDGKFAINNDTENIEVYEVWVCSEYNGGTSEYLKIGPIMISP